MYVAADNAAVFDETAWRLGGKRRSDIFVGSVASLCCPSGQVQAVAWQESDEPHRYGRIRLSKGGSSPLR
jgi:hypothetical protein